MSKHEATNTVVDARTTDTATLAKHRENYGTQTNPVTGEPIEVLNGETYVRIVNSKGEDVQDNEGNPAVGIIWGAQLNRETGALEDYVIVQESVIPLLMMGIPVQALYEQGLATLVEDSGVCTVDGVPIVIGRAFDEEEGE